VHLAPLAQEIVISLLSVKRAISFRTRAGVLGLIHRLGIDWHIHIPISDRDLLLSLARDSLPRIIEDHLSLETRDTLDGTSLGYCCEAAVKLNVFSSEFIALIQEYFIEYPHKSPPLAVSQIVDLLSRRPDSVDRVFWESLVNKILASPGEYTPQNWIQILEGTTRAGYYNGDLLERACIELKSRTIRMRLSDCSRACRAITSMLYQFSIDPEILADFSRAVQRRATVLIVTSPTPVSISETLQLSSSFHRFAAMLSASDRSANYRIHNSFDRLLAS
jgi:hypothetical protein